MIILIIIALIIAAAIYFNLAWYLTKNLEKTINTVAAGMNFFQKLQLGPGEKLTIFVSDNSSSRTLHMPQIKFLLYYFLWPIMMAVTLISWIVYFIFFGGFTKLVFGKNRF